MKGYDDWRLSSPNEEVEVFTTDEFNYTSEILANVEEFDKIIARIRKADFWCEIEETDLEAHAEELAKELGLK